MKGQLERLIQKILAESGSGDPNHLALVSRVATDYVGLTALHLSGGDVAEELAIVEASAMNLDRGAKRVIGENISQFMTEATQSLLIKLLVP